MCIHDGKVPQFYKEYVDEIIAWVRENARKEFECIHREHERTGKPRCILTDILSLKINEINNAIMSSKLWDDKEFVRVVMKQALPQTLIRKLGLETCLERVPDSYLKAIFSSYLAKEYVYAYGLQANEFSFFEFMQKRAMWAASCCPTREAVSRRTTRASSSSSLATPSTTGLASRHALQALL